MKTSKQSSFQNSALTFQMAYTSPYMLKQADIAVRCRNIFAFSKKKIKKMVQFLLATNIHQEQL